MLKRHMLIIGMVLMGLLSGCATAPPENPGTNPYTSGNVSLTLQKGVTTQAEVLEAFGAPNVVTQGSDESEEWVYQKNATVSKSNTSNSFATILLLGGSRSSSGFEQSSRTMTLIIRFDKSKKVIGFKSLATSF